jgi:hypothetical protein
MKASYIIKNRFVYEDSSEPENDVKKGPKPSRAQEEIQRKLEKIEDFFDSMMEDKKCICGEMLVKAGERVSIYEIINNEGKIVEISRIFILRRYACSDHEKCGVVYNVDCRDFHVTIPLYVFYNFFFQYFFFEVQRI